MHGRVRTDHPARLGALQQPQLGQHHHVFVHALDVALHQAGQLAHRQLALALRGAYQRPALFGQLAKEMARAFKVEHLALVSAFLRRLGGCTQTGLPVQMAVVAFAPLVVKANDANAILGIDRTVFETVLGGIPRDLAKYVKFVILLRPFLIKQRL